MANPEAVAFVIADLDCGGTQRVVTTMANEWAMRGRKVTVVTFASTDRDFFALHPRVRRIVLGGLGVSRSVWAGFFANFRRIVWLRKVIKSIDAPIIVGFLAQTNITLVLAGVSLGRRIVISERNNPQRQSLGPIWDRLRYWCYRLANVVTANSREALVAMRDFVPDRKLAYLPNPLSPLSDRHEPGREEIILSIARLEPHKGLDVLIDAFATIRGRYPSWRLRIVGEGPLQEALMHRARDRGVGEHVCFDARVRNPYSLYHRAGIFVLASQYEGTPNAVLEAMSCCVPPIVSDRSAGALEYVEDGASGLVVATGDAATLAKALERLIADESLRRALGRAARERVGELSLEKVSAIWEDVLFPGWNHT